MHSTYHLFLWRVQIFVDTTGWAFTYPLARLAGCKVVAYTHYPMVSANMLQRVMLRTSTYNNQLAVAKSGIRSLIKVVYYYVVAAIYGAAGGFANVSCIMLCCQCQLSLECHIGAVLHAQISACFAW